MSVDYRWMSNGGLLLDGSGDIAFTESPEECAISMVRSRIKAAVDGWKQYRIGAGLNDYIGNTSDAGAEISIQRRVLAALSNKYLPSSTFDVRTLRLGSVIQVFVYISDKLIAQITVTPNPNNTAA